LIQNKIIIPITLIKNTDILVQPYTPEPLPIKTLDKDVLFTAVGEANAALARYDGLLIAMVNPAV